MTGVGGGQGREIALMFAQAGAVVVGCSNEQPGLDETARIAAGMGLILDLSVVDAADQSEVLDWIGQVARRHGGIDVLYNNAALAHFAPFRDLTLNQWRETLHFELDIVFVPSQAVWPHMVARGGGSIINVASVAGMAGLELIGEVGQSAHCAGKSGVIGLTRQMAVEGAPHWIRVNAISPGPIMSPPTLALLEGNAHFKKFFNGITLLPRPGWPPDVGYAALFLASDESAFITGVNLPVDGGATCKLGIHAAPM